MNNKKLTDAMKQIDGKYGYLKNRDGISVTSGFFHYDEGHLGINHENVPDSWVKEINSEEERPIVLINDRYKLNGMKTR